MKRNLRENWQRNGDFNWKRYESYMDCPQAYRSVIINGLNKLVYRIDGDTIYIVGFWDTRMDDKEQALHVM